MTLREMFKKIDTYNEIAKMVGSEQLRIHIMLDYCSEEFDDYKSYLKYAKANFAEDLIETIAGYKNFVFGETCEIVYKCYGLNTNLRIEINAYSKY